MKFTLRDVLWRSGFRSLLVGFCFLNVIIFSFFFLELNGLYSQLNNYSQNITIASKEIIDRYKSELHEVSQTLLAPISDVINKFDNIANQTFTSFMSDKLIVQIQKDITIDINQIFKCAAFNITSGCVCNKNGMILGQSNLEKYNFLSEELLALLYQAESNSIPQYLVSDIGVIIVSKLPTKFDSYLILFKQINLTLFKKFVKFNATYNDKSIRMQIFTAILLIFLIIIGLFLFYSSYVVKRVSGKIINNLNQLMFVADKVQELRNIKRIPKLEIKEFHDITAILVHNLQDIHAMNIRLEHTNKELNDKNMFIQEVLDNISSGVILLNDNLDVLLINQKAQKLLKISDVEIGLANKYTLPLAKNLKEIFPDALLVIDALKQAKHALSKQIDVGLNRFVINASFIDQRILITFEDLSYQISLQKQVAWKDVARVIAHEVKNPLTPTRLSAEQLLNTPNIDPEKKERYLRTIINNVEHVNKLIMDFTSFTKHTQQTLELQDIDLKPFLLNIINEQKLMYKNVRYKLHNIKDVIIKGDFKQLTQAVTNLLQNAGQAFDDTILNPQIDVRYQLLKNTCAIIITDNGVGIKKDNVEKLFQPYMTTKTYGTGLGLVIVRKIAQAHGGDVELIPQEQGVKTVLKIYHRL